MLLGQQRGHLQKLQSSLDPKRFIQPLLKGDLSVLMNGVVFDRAKRTHSQSKDPVKNKPKTDEDKICSTPSDAGNRENSGSLLGIAEMGDLGVIVSENATSIAAEPAFVAPNTPSSGPQPPEVGLYDGSESADVSVATSAWTAQPEEEFPDFEVRMWTRKVLDPTGRGWGKGWVEAKPRSRRTPRS